MSTTYYDPWASIKRQLLAGLYSAQIKHWNTELVNLIQVNAQQLGTSLSLQMCHRATIQFNNKSWSVVPTHWLQGVENVSDYCFPLADSASDLIPRLQNVTTELQKIVQERYESDRFISTLAMFGLSGNELHQILGDNLYRLISKSADTLFRDSTEIFQPMPLDEFLLRNDKILDHMQERVMVNYLMTDILES